MNLDEVNDNSYHSNGTSELYQPFLSIACSNENPSDINDYVDENSRSRSRSPHVKTEKGSPDRNRTQKQQRSSGHRSHANLSDRELGLKYKWDKTVYVSNIPFDVKWTELKDLFRGKVGDVQYCEIFERNGKSYGCGAVEFKHDGDAEKAIEVLDSYEMENRKIHVHLDSDGSQTRRTKEICRKTELKDARKHGSRTTSTSNNKTTTASLMSLNQANTFATIGALNQTANVNQTLTSILGLVAQPIIPANHPANQTQMLNQLAQQLNIEGPVTSNVFVANLDFKVNESKLREVFNLAGKVSNVSLFRDRDGRNRGIALVEYATGLEALNAITMFDKQVLNDREMSVRFDTKPKESEPNLPSGLKTIGNSLTSLGGLNFLQQPIENPSPLAGLDALAVLAAGLNQTSGQMQSLSSVTGFNSSLTTQNLGNQLNNLNSLFNLTGSNNPTQVQFNSQPKQNICTVFVKNLPYNWDDRQLKDKFRRSGPVEFAEIQYRDGKSRGCGLIKYYSATDAQRAVEMFNQSRFDGRTLEVKLDQMSSQ